MFDTDSSHQSRPLLFQFLSLLFVAKDEFLIDTCPFLLKKKKTTLDLHSNWDNGASPSCHRTMGQFITGPQLKDKQRFPLTHTHLRTIYRPQCASYACFSTVGGSWTTQRKPKQHRENMHFPQRKVLYGRRLNLQPSCCHCRTIVGFCFVNKYMSKCDLLKVPKQLSSNDYCSERAEPHWFTYLTT